MYTNTIEAIQKCNPWDGPYGRMYYYTLLLSDGTIADVTKKKENAFTVGQELTYTLEDGERRDGSTYKKLKEVKEEWNPTSQRSSGGSGDPRSFALSYAKDIAVAFITCTPDIPDDNDVLTESILKRAGAFTQWLTNNQVANANDNNTTDNVSVPAYTGVEHQTTQATPIVQGSTPEAEATRRNSFNSPSRPQIGGTSQGAKHATTNQLNMLWKLAEERGVNLNQLISNEFSDIREPNELSTLGASYFIDMLIGMKGGK